MTAYQVALLLHLLALLAATAASALVHYANHRRVASPSLRQAMEWGRLASVTARVFPVAVLVLVVTGAYMVAQHWTWRVGWVEAGLVGALLLPVVGAVIGKRGAAGAKRCVERLQTAGHDLPNDLPPDRVGAALGNANTWLAIGIVVIMTMKPGLGASVLMLAGFALAGGLLGARAAVPRAAAATDTEAEAA